MEQDAFRLSQLLVSKLAIIPPPARLLVGICGIPASGKSTFAELVTKHTNTLLDQDQTILVGLDGWHLTRAQLDAFPDPKLAHDRRGSHWTFDGLSYLAFVQKLRAIDNQVITAPSFDHALKDPDPNGVKIHPHHRIVIIEGLYTCLNVEHWGEAAKLLDERWYIRVGIPEATKRLVKRHVQTGVAKDIEHAHWRAEQNDIPNGAFVVDNMIEPTQVIESVEDPVFALGNID